MNPVILDDTLPLTMMQPVDPSTGKFRFDVWLQRQSAAEMIACTDDPVVKAALEEEDRLAREKVLWRELPYMSGKVRVRKDGRWQDAWTMHSILWEKLAPHQREGAIVIQHIRVDKERQDAREQMLSQEAE